MKQKPYVIIIFLLALLISVSVLVFYVRIPSKVLQPLGQTILNQLEVNLDRQINATKFYTNFVSRFYLENFVVSSGKNNDTTPLLSAESLTVGYRFWDLIRYQQTPEKSLSKLVLNSARIYLTNRDGDWNFVFPQKKPMKMVLPKIYFEDTTLQIEDVTGKIPALYLTNISGFFFEKDKNIIFRFNGKTDSDKKTLWRLEGNAQIKENNFGLELKGKNIDLSLAEKYLARSSEVVTIDGFADGKFVVQGEKFSVEDFNKWSYQGTLVLRQGKVKFINVSQPVSDINGELDLSNNGLEIRQLQVGVGSSTVKLQGRIDNLFNQPRLNIKLNTEVNNKDLGSLLLPNQTSSLWKGKTNIDCSIQGTTTNYVVVGKIQSPWFEYQGWKLNDLVADFNYSQSRLATHYRAKFYDGMLQGNGSIENDRILFKGQVKNTDVGRLVERFISSSDKNLVKGYTDINYQLTGSFDSPRIETEIKGQNLLLWDKEKVDLAKIDFTIDYPDNIQVQGYIQPQDYQLSLLAGYDPKQGTNVKELVFSSRLENKIVARGKIGLKEDLLLSVQTNKFNISDIPYFNQFYKPQKGFVKINGEIKGKVSVPEISINFSGEEEIFGKVSGTLFSKPNGKTIEIESKIESRNGGFEGFNWEILESSISNDKKDLTSFLLMIKQKEGKAVIRAKLQNIPGKKRQDVQVDGEMSQLNWNDNLFTNKFNLTGAIDKNNFTANLVSPYCLANSKSFGTLEGKISYNYNAKILRLDSWHWGENILANTEISFVPKEEKIDSRIILRSIDYKDLEKMFVLSNQNLGLKGRINAEATIWGNFYSPQSKGNFVLQDGEYQGKDVKLQGKYTYNRKVLVPEIDISVRDGLKTTVTGQVIYTKSETRSEWQSAQIDYGNFTLKDTKLELILSNNRANILSFVSKLPAGEVNILKGSFIEFPSRTVDKDMKFMLCTKLRNINLSNFDFWGGVDFEGKYNWITGDSPRIESRVRLNDFWFNQYNVASGQFQLNYYKNVITFVPTNEKVTISGQLDLTQLPKIVMNNINLQKDNNNLILAHGELGPEKWNFSIEGHNFPAEIIMGISNLKIPSSGNTEFHFLGSGDSKTPHLSGRLEITQGSYYNVSFDALNMLFSYRDDVFYLKNVYAFANKKFSFTGKGEFPLPSEEKTKSNQSLKLNFKLNKGDLSMLDGLSDKIVRAQGLWEAEGEIGGTVEDLRLKGTISVYNGEIQLQDFAKKISAFNAEIILSEKDILFERFVGRIGNGIVQLSGKVTLSGTKVNNYDLALKTVGKSGADLNIGLLSIPQSTVFKRIFSTPAKGEAKLDLTLSGSAERPVLKGTIELSNSHFTFPPIEYKGDEFIENLIKPIYWDLVLQTGQNVWYENELVSVNTKGWLNFSGKTDSLKVNGKFESLKGDLNYLGRNFDIRMARFEIVDNVAYLEGSAEIQSYVENKPGQDEKIIPSMIMLSIDRSKLEDIKPKFSSKERPDLSPEKVVASLVLAGKENLPGSLTSEEQMNFLRKELVHWIDSSVVMPITKTILRQTGMDFNLRVTQDPGTTKDIEPQRGIIPTSVPEWFYGTNITLERNITDQTRIGYSLKLRKPELVANPLDLHHEIELTQRWKNIVLKGSYGFYRKSGESSIPSPSWETERKISVETQKRFGWDE